MNSFLNQETPGKVMALVGTALFSMAFLFSVTVTEASFSGSSVALQENIFQPTTVVAVVDSFTSSYAKFLTANLFAPLSETYAFAADTVNYISDNASEPIVQLAGLDRFLQKPVDYGVVRPQVAGASITALTSR
jgi:hypothetical protein